MQENMKTKLKNLNLRSDFLEPVKINLSKERAGEIVQKIHSLP